MLLMNEISNKSNTSGKQHIILPTNLVIRQSTSSIATIER